MPLKIDIDGCKLKLFTPGPVWVPERLLKELAKPNDTHRSRFIEDLTASIKEGLQKVMYTSNDVVLFTTSGSGIMEACYKNLLKDDEKALCFSCGAFGDRWAKMGKANGKKVDVVRLDNGQGFSPEIVKEALAKDKYAMVTLTHNETSCGLTNPIYDIAPVIKDSGALFCVDAVSSLAGIKVEVDKLGIDVCLTSSQKAFAIPPGLAMASVSDRAYEKAKTVPSRGLYLDFIEIKKKGDVNQSPTTPPVPQMRALDAQLTYILNEEGLDERFARHAEMARVTREWAKSEGFEMFSQDGFHSNTVSCIANNLDINLDGLTKGLQGKGYKIVNGYGDMCGKNFRIGHMGELTVQDTKDMLKALSEVKASL